MDLDSLKGKTIDDATLAQLKSWAEGLTTRAETAEEKARTATNESINGRKTLKAERDAAFEKLGVETMDELKALPDARGQAEARSQLDARLKRVERERDEAVAKAERASGELSGMRKKAAIQTAISKHRFLDAELAELAIGARVRQEGDDFLFEGEGGRLIPIEEGAAWVAKTKPHLIDASSKGGSGYTGNAGGGRGATNPYAVRTFNLTKQIELERVNPTEAAALKAAAQAESSAPA